MNLMAMKGTFFFGFFLCASSALRLATQESIPERQIVYEARWKAGISDIAEQFNWLTHLGNKWGATVSMHQLNTKQWLTRKHSKCIAESWSEYFDTSANRGNPWHSAPASNAETKCIALSKDADFEHLFAEGQGGCVRILDDYWHLDAAMETGHMFNQEYLTHIFHSKWTALRPSAQVVQSATDFLTKHNISGDFSTIHVRRCDRLKETAKCTSPDAIYNNMKNRPEIQTFIIFTYAEKDYKSRLESKLATLGKRIVFEDDMCDNYFSYLRQMYLNGLSNTILDTHQCWGDQPNRIDIKTTDTIMMPAKPSIESRISWYEEQAVCR